MTYNSGGDYIGCCEVFFVSGECRRTQQTPRYSCWRGCSKIKAKYTWKSEIKS